MIYTLTLSPSLDYVITSEKFLPTGVTRINQATILPGGKGVNASVVLSRLGFLNEAISFFDQQSLHLINKYFNKEKVNLFNIPALENTRINVKFSTPQTHFELNGQKTKINAQMLKQLKDKLASLTKDDFLLIMGLSDEKVLKTILNFVKKQKIPFLMDIDSPNLKQYVSNYQPYLIKPNKDELQRLFNLKLNNQKDVIKALHSIQKLGAQNVMISLDSQGSYLLTNEQKVYKAKIVKSLEKVVSAIGAGDTLIASFAAFYQKSGNALKAFHKANAAAMGTVSQTWLTDKKLMNKYLSYLTVKQIN